MEKTQQKVVALNRRARHEYHVLESYEAGIELKGTEVKSIRQGGLSLAEAYVVLKGGQALLTNAHIAPYEQGNRFNHDPLRERRLLLHKHEIIKLDIAVARKGLTLVPLKAYFKRGKVKLEIGLCRGKKLYDKRADIRERDVARKLARRENDI